MARPVIAASHAEARAARPEEGSRPGFAVGVWRGLLFERHAVEHGEQLVVVFLAGAQGLLERLAVL